MHYLAERRAAEKTLNNDRGTTPRCTAAATSRDTCPVSTYEQHVQTYVPLFYSKTEGAAGNQGTMLANLTTYVTQQPQRGKQNTRNTRNQNNHRMKSIRTTSTVGGTYQGHARRSRMSSSTVGLAAPPPVT